MRSLIAYLEKKYAPLGLICYGSYSDGTQTTESDFDALLICRDREPCHDMEVVDGVKLDVFVYPEEYIRNARDLDAFIQIYDGEVVLDQTGGALELLERVRRHVDAASKKTPEEKAELKNWCLKMLARSKRGDAEGLYRGHWLLTDSLQIYCDLRDRFYFGPKKTIQWLKEKDFPGYDLLSQALEDLNRLENWIQYIIDEQKGADNYEV